MNKVLIFDIETAPMIAYVWDRKDQNIGLNQINRDWSVIAWAAKWLGDPASSTIYYDQRSSKNIEDDRAILKPLWELLNEADIVITQNGKNFDSKKLNARFIIHGFKPPSPYQHLDTYQIARRAASFTSNKLEYLTEKLCKKYKKLSHKAFPGMSLWDECLKGNKDAWNEMKRYNIHDVLSTEELYTILKAWVPATAPDVYDADPDRECGVCGGKLAKQGTKRRRNKTMQRYCCSGCGRWTDKAIKGDA